MLFIPRKATLARPYPGVIQPKFHAARYLATLLSEFYLGPHGPNAFFSEIWFWMVWLKFRILWSILLFVCEKTLLEPAPQGMGAPKALSALRGH